MATEPLQKQMMALDAIDPVGVFKPGGEMVDGTNWVDLTLVQDEHGGMRGVWFGFREVVDLWGAVGWFWPELLLLVLVVLSVVGVWWWMRRRKLREVRHGEAYCRKCGYVLEGMKAKHAERDRCPECGVRKVGVGERNYRVRRWGGKGSKLHWGGRVAGILLIALWLVLLSVTGIEFGSLRSKGYSSQFYGDWSWLRLNPNRPWRGNWGLVCESRWLYELLIKPMDQAIYLEGNTDPMLVYLHNTAKNSMKAYQDVMCEVDLLIGQKKSAVYSSTLMSGLGTYKPDDYAYFSTLHDARKQCDVYQFEYLSEEANEHWQFYQRSILNNIQSSNTIKVATIDRELFIYSTQEQLFVMGDAFGQQSICRLKIMYQGDDLLEGLMSMAEQDDVRKIEGKFYWFVEKANTGQSGKEAEIYVVGCLDITEKMFWVSVREKEGMGEERFVGFEGHDELATYDVMARQWVDVNGKVAERSDAKIAWRQLTSKGGNVVVDNTVTRGVKYSGERYQYRVIDNFSYVKDGKELRRFGLMKLGETRKKWLLNCGEFSMSGFNIDEKQGRVYAADTRRWYSDGLAVYVYEPEGLGDEQEKE